MSNSRHNNNDKRYYVQAYMDYQAKNGSIKKRWQNICNGDMTYIAENFYELYSLCIENKQHVRIYDKETHKYYNDDEKLKNLQLHFNLVYLYLSNFREYIDEKENAITIGTKDCIYDLSLNSFLENDYFKMIHDIRDVLEHATGAELTDIYTRCGVGLTGDDIK